MTIGVLSTDHAGSEALVVRAGGEINGAQSGGEDIVLSSSSAQATLQAGRGIGGKGVLAVAAASIVLDNERGDVNIASQGELAVKGLSQRGEGEIRITGERGITLAGTKPMSVGGASLRVETKGQGELVVRSDLTSMGGNVALVSNRGISLAQGVDVQCGGKCHSFGQCEGDYGHGRCVAGWGGGACFSGGFHWSLG